MTLSQFIASATFTHEDLLARAATAFDSYAEILSACRADGYVPTLYPRTPAARALRTALARDGIRVRP